MDKHSEILRLFIAFPLDASVRETLGKVQRYLPSHYFKPLPMQNLHMTLVFLGDTPTARVAEIEEASRKVAGEFHPFECELSGMGAFPNPWEPRVVWAGIDVGSREGGLVSESLRRELRDRKVPFDQKPFKPHITLAYARKHLSRSETREAGAQFVNLVSRRDQLSQQGGEKGQQPAALGNLVPRIRFSITGFTLFKSELRPQGSLYVPLLRLRLGERGGNGANGC